MTVTVDHEPLQAEALGLRTVGQVLSHVQRDHGRLVVHLLIDGREPDLDAIGQVRQAPLAGHTLSIETAEPRRVALDVLDGVEVQLREADRLKAEACDLLARNDVSRAMEKLSGCFSTWQVAQESVLKTAQLLRIDLSALEVNGRPLDVVVAEFTGQLREIRAALECRDFVLLSDVLTYEMTETTRNWRLALGAIRGVVGE
jgi:hypothetical protein